MNYFFDTSALVKIFHKEAGSETIMELLKKKEAHIWISELARLEFVSALYKRMRMGDITEKRLDDALLIFESVVKSFRIEPLGAGVLLEAELLIKKYARKAGLRTLDALHLATFNLVSEKNWKFVVADDVLGETAKKIGISVINPLK